MKSTYLLLAIIGAVVPLIFFGQFFSSGQGAGDFIQAAFANKAAAGLTADLLITSLVFWLVMFQRRSKGGPAPWGFIVVNLFIGLSCALPAYLWFSYRSQSDG